MDNWSTTSWMIIIYWISKARSKIVTGYSVSMSKRGNRELVFWLVVADDPWASSHETQKGFDSLTVTSTTVYEYKNLRRTVAY